LLLDITITKKHKNMIIHRRDAGGKDFYYSKEAIALQPVITIL
jgi:hypothetical protein